MIFSGNSKDHCSTGCQVGFGRCEGVVPLVSAAEPQKPNNAAATPSTSSPTSSSPAAATTGPQINIGYTCDDDFWWRNNYCYKYMGANGQMKRMTSAFCYQWSGKMSDVPNWLSKDCEGDIERIRGACCGRWIVPQDAVPSSPSAPAATTPIKLARRQDDASGVGRGKGPSPWARVAEYLARKQAQAAGDQADRRTEEAATRRDAGTDEQGGSTDKAYVRGRRENAAAATARDVRRIVGRDVLV